MQLKQLLGRLLLGLSLGLCSQMPAQADPVLDAGWDDDVISDDDTDSADSPYDFSLSASAFFRITDAFLVTDVYTVRDSGTIILVTALGTPPVRTPFGDDAFADAAWVSPVYTHGEILLAAGAHSLTVQGDCQPGSGGAGCPAGFFVRLDSAGVPEPATLGLLALGLMGIGFLRRRRTR